MKKRLLSLIVTLVVTLTTYAADYTYLTFVTTDGEKTSVAVSSLTLTISGTTLTAGGRSFTLSNLSKMYFSDTDESGTTGLETLSTETLDDTVEIYDLNGRKMTKTQLPNGVYIVKTKTGTHKIVKK